MPDDNKALSPLQVNSWPVPRQRVTITGDPLPDASTQTEADKLQDFLNEARERFKVCVAHEEANRREMLVDLQFYAGEQWDERVKKNRERPDAPRPCLTINRCKGFVGHVVNQYAQAPPEIRVNPAGDGADEEDADIRQGLIRSIEQHSQAEAARKTAFRNLCIMGLGWTRVIDDWSYPKAFTKDLYLQWVKNPFQVYCDPFYKQPDSSDKEYLFFVEDFTKQEFIDQFGEKYEAVSLSEFSSLGDQQKEWFPGGKIRVAEYWYTRVESDTLLLLSNGETVYKSEFDKNPPPPVVNETGEQVPVEVQQERPCKRRVVYQSLITAVDKLRERKWKGQYIPWIPYIGDVVELADGEKPGTMISGMIRIAREPQRMYNYMYSSLVEAAGLATKSQWIAAEGQIDKYWQEWQESNVKPTSVLRYVQVPGEDGRPAPPPQRIGTGIDITPYVQGIQVADQQLKAVFNIWDASLGQRGPQESGKAINARKVESETGNFNWVDTASRAIRLEGIILDDLLQYYYNTPGRIIQVIRDDQTRDQVKLLTEVEDKQTGRPRVYDLAKGRYGIVVTAEPSYETRRKEAAQQMWEYAKADPRILEAAGDIIFRESDFPGKDAIADRLEKMLPPGMKPLDKNLQIPPALQGEFQKMQQMIQALTEELNKANDKSHLEQIKQDNENFRKSIDAEVQIITAELKAKTEESSMLAKETFNHLDWLRNHLEGRVEAAEQSGLQQSDQAHQQAMQQQAQQQQPEPPQQ